MRAASSRGTTHAHRALLGSAALGNSTATMAAGGNGSREGGPKHRDPRASGPSQAHRWPKGTNGYTWTGANMRAANVPQPSGDVPPGQSWCSTPRWHLTPRALTDAVKQRLDAGGGGA